MTAPAVEFTAPGECPPAPLPTDAGEAYLAGVRDGQDAGLVVGRAVALDEVAAVQLDRRRRRLILATEGAAVGLGWVLGSLLAQAADGAR